MGEMLHSLYYRLSSEAYDLPAVIVELFLIGLCVNWVAGLLQATRGTRPLRGVLIILIVVTLVVRVLTEQFQWVRLDLLYKYILYGLAFIALVVFQPELRRAVIRVGDVRLRRSREPYSQTVAALVKSAGYLSRNKYGAVVAIQRGVDLTGWAENGTLIKADVSANLLDALFFPNSPLHDLGVIIQGNCVVAANCQFPSAESDEVNLALGSRHLAAVGMSYETDALVLVVSEETGIISLADNGKLTRYLSLDDLAEELNGRLAGTAANQREHSPRRLLRGTWRRLRRALMVVPLTLVIWYVADQATFARDNVPVKLDIRQDDPMREIAIGGPPPVFQVTFSGPGRAIDRLRASHGNQPLTVTWPLPKAYLPRREPYLLESRAEIQQIVATARQVTERGLNVVDVTLPSLGIHVYELVSISLPVRVKAEGGAVRIAVEHVDPPMVDVRVRRDDLPILEAQGYVLATLGQQLEGLTPGEVKAFAPVPLKEPAGLTGPALFTPSSVTIAVRVVAQSRLVRNVVVGLYVAPEVAERYEVRHTDLNEWRIDVEVQGDEAVFEAVGPPEIEAFVHVTADLIPAADKPAEEQFRTLDVIFLPPKGVSVLERRTVRVTLVPLSRGTP
jgi:diadenylate cyclase